MLPANAFVVVAEAAATGCEGKKHESSVLFTFSYLFSIFLPFVSLLYFPVVFITLLLSLVLLFSLPLFLLSICPFAFMSNISLFFFFFCFYFSSTFLFPLNSISSFIFPPP